MIHNFKLKWTRFWLGYHEEVIRVHRVKVKKYEERWRRLILGY